MYRNIKLANIKISTPKGNFMDKRTFNESEKEKFRKYAEKISPNSKLIKDCLLAFIIGGVICSVGELILDTGKIIGISEENLKIFVPCSLIIISNILTATGSYHKLAKHAGAGTIVPITGFANAISSISIDSVSEGYVLGVGAKMFTIAGPVILYGVSSSVLYGIIYYIFTVLAI